MNRKAKLIVLAMFLFCATLQAAAQKVAVTNSWTAAYAKAAGVQNVVQLAPADMVHPPEYELKPSDLKTIADSEYLIYAGYEVMMKTVFDQLKKEESKMIKIQTAYDPQQMKNAINSIAEKCGNSSTAQKSNAQIDAFFAEAVDELKKMEMHGKPVLVHFHQKAFIESLGFEVAGVFGPAPLKAGDIQKMGGTKPVLIIDNAHNPQGAPLAEVTKAPVVQLVNFPGFQTTSGSKAPSSLSGILRFNYDIVVKELLKTPVK